jgi:hypothetical protein
VLLKSDSYVKQTGLWSSSKTFEKLENTYRETNALAYFVFAISGEEKVLKCRDLIESVSLIPVSIKNQIVSH